MTSFPSGYGTTGWGTSALGAGTSPLQVENAFATSTHEVVVTLTKSPMDVSGFVVGDASNPRSWSVTTSAGQVLDVAGVTAYERPLRWTVRTLQRLPDSTGTAVVSVAGLLDSGGFPADGATAYSFTGVTELAISTPTKLALSRGGTRDLRNDPVPDDLERSIAGGTLSIVGGDYALVEGTDLIRKLITRRVNTIPGEFFHLPNYGVGLAIKQPLPGGGVARLKKRIEQQVLLEPDVRSVGVSITQSSSTVSIVVRAVAARTGQQVTVSINSQIGQE